MKTITEETLKRYEEYLLSEEKSENTAAAYIRYVRFFSNRLGDGGLDKTAVLEYKKELCGRYSPASVNAILSALNSFFEFSGRRELRVKAVKVQRRIFSGRERELTKPEYERLLSAAKKRGDSRLYCLIQTIASTGIRVSELKHIDVKAVDAGRAEIECKGKYRTVLLPKQLCRLLRRYLKERGIEEGSVFRTRSGKAIDRSNIWRMLKGVCVEAGVAEGKVFPHNLRHLFARTFYALQKDIVRLADILGHASINTTRIYTRESGETHRRQIERLALARC